MKGRLLQRTSNMGVLLQHEGSHVQDIGALLGPGTSAAGLLESQYMVNLDGAGNENGQVFCTPAELQEACDDDSDGCLQRPEKKRRLTSDQVQFLERSFELENRLEPERKVQIAQHLGLQPRQIAIWFQNRRARWKTKQLEKEYDTLKFSYDSLKSDHDILVKEKEELEAQVLSLTNKLFTTRNKDHTDFELSKLHKFSVSLETRDSSLVSEVGNANAKQEDVRSANSTVLDSESPPDTDEGRHFSMMELTCCSSDAFEPVRSDLSQVADADEIKGRVILSRLEDDSCTYEFQLEDQYFFFWP